MLIQSMLGHEHDTAFGTFQRRCRVSDDVRFQTRLMRESLVAKATRESAAAASLQLVRYGLLVAVEFLPAKTTRLTSQHHVDALVRDCLQHFQQTSSFEPRQ